MIEIIVAIIVFMIMVGVLCFARPFASYERGTSENQHKLIRRFIPKGQPISKISDRQIQRIQRWMNDYPREILDYQTPHECFVKAFKQTQPAQSA